MKKTIESFKEELLFWVSFLLCEEFVYTMSLNVSYKGVLSKIPCETYHKATDLLEHLSVLNQIILFYSIESI